MANLEAGFSRITWVIASVIALAGFVLAAMGVIGPYPHRPLAALAAAFGLFGFCAVWGSFFLARWVALGFTTDTVPLPIYDKTSGEVLLAGYDPAGSDFPLGGLHATLPVIRACEPEYQREERSCSVCGQSAAETMLVGSPRGLRCLKHAEWYARLTMVKQYAIVCTFWLLTLVGVAATLAFAWQWIITNQLG